MMKIPEVPASSKAVKARRLPSGDQAGSKPKARKPPEAPGVASMMKIPEVLLSRAVSTAWGVVVASRVSEGSTVVGGSVAPVGPDAVAVSAGGWTGGSWSVHPTPRITDRMITATSRKATTGFLLVDVFDQAFRTTTDS